jgi:cytoskeletal protein CcmA (bactofilin family)
MFNKWQSGTKNQINTLIGEGTRIAGNVSFSGGLRLDGEVSGNIQPDPSSDSTLVLGATGSVKGEISGTHLVLNGLVDGTVRAEKFLELQSKAQITGDVHYKTIEIQLGAIIVGHLKHNNDTHPLALKVS